MVIDKSLSELTCAGKTLTVKLSQEDTLKLHQSEFKTAEVQIRVRMKSGDALAYGYGKGTTSGYTTPQYAFCGDKYYTMASWGNPTPKSMTISVDENGNITGLPALASGNLTIVRTP